MRNFFIAFLFSLCLGTTTFAADQYMGVESFEVPQGFSVGITANFGGATGDMGDFYKPGGGLGLSISYRPSLTFSVYLEAIVNYVYPDTDLLDGYSFMFAQGNIGLNFYLMPTSQFQPFLTAGFGNFNISAVEEESGESFEGSNQQTVFFGGGIEYALSPTMTIPVKVQFTKIFTEDGEGTYKDMLWNVMAGINIYF